MSSLHDVNNFTEEISSNVCRICLLKSKILKSMFHCSVGSQTYADLYRVCTGYTVNEGPDLPYRICNECERKLLDFHNFRVSIESIEERLQSHQYFIDSKNDETEWLEDYDEEKLNENINPDENCEIIQTDTLDDEVVYLEEVIDQNEDEFVQYNSENEFERKKEEILNNTESFCRFAFSEGSSSEVQCLTCSKNCELEKFINEANGDESLTVICECERAFRNKKFFLKHYSQRHSANAINHTCEICHEVFKSVRSKAAHDAYIHNIGYKFECTSCKKKFYRSDHLKQHEKCCNKSKKKTKSFFKCDICLLAFEREETYKKHLKSAHNNVKNTNEVIQLVEAYAERYSNNRSCASESAASEDASMKVLCCHCNKTFKNENTLNKHINVFHGNQVWPCEKCDAVFIHRSTRISHMTLEHGARKPFECTYRNCDFSCFKRDRFNAHIDKHENPDKKFSCPICQQEFNGYNTMTLHRAKHSKQKTFECSICSKQFLDKRNFNAHVKLHTGENLFHCPVCTRGFNRKDHLQKHQKRKNHFEDFK